LSGTFTITGGSYAPFAETVSQSTATVTVLTTINGVTKMQIEHRQDTYNQQK
jgi:hypothetical protein